MNSKGHLTLAALQFTPSPSLTETITDIGKLVSHLISQGYTPDCIVLPEYAFGTLRNWKEEGWEEQLLQVKKAISSLCQEYHVPIVAGSVPYKTRRNRWRNRSYLFSSDGRVIGVYDKQRPFRTEILMGLEPGKRTPIFKLAHLRLAILLCSDLWFPGLVRQASKDADFIAVPAMTTVLNQRHIAYGRWAWHSLVVVRSKENAIPIVSADHAVGVYTSGIYTCGASCIADPSHRFDDEEGPHTQALKVADPKSQAAIVSTISQESIEEYKAYRRRVGLLK